MRNQKWSRTFAPPFMQWYNMAYFLKIYLSSYSLLRKTRERLVLDQSYGQLVRVYDNILVVLHFARLVLLHMVVFCMDVELFVIHFENLRIKQDFLKKHQKIT